MKGFAQKLIEKVFKQEKAKRVKPRHVANPQWEREENPDKFLDLRVSIENQVSCLVFRFDPAQTVGEVLKELSTFGYGVDPDKVKLYPAEQKVGDFELQKKNPKPYDQSKTLSELGLKNKTYVKVGE